MSTAPISVTYSSIDRFRQTRSFRTLAAARSYAARWVGAHPEFGSSYAISDDGVGKITVRGASLAELFGVATAATAESDGYAIAPKWDGYDGYFQITLDGRPIASLDTHEEAVAYIDACRVEDVAHAADCAEMAEEDFPF